MLWFGRRDWLWLRRGYSHLGMDWGVWSGEKKGDDDEVEEEETDEEDGASAGYCVYA